MSRSAQPRPSVFADVDLNIAKEAPQPEPAQTAAEAPQAKADKEVIKTSTYLPRPVHDVLREIAFHERSKVHDLLMEGVEHVLKSRRHPSVAELKAQDGA
ncbi:hypothetical protein [Aurantimonas sp. VKM B-3413]|uniref:hypothetical protein n=1 Tax=Aurantimonas sp. VKM B-3413 TaxID=2779401 RepID=UPI001E41FF44|nr:hypothetical protein [Aurantimonas sp. VKM B-3413]MCB8835816.1 hypothetical protein [Aurantimonas sp. VKM B-3413]